MLDWNLPLSSAFSPIKSVTNVSLFKGVTQNWSLSVTSLHQYLPTNLDQFKPTWATGWQMQEAGVHVGVNFVVWTAWPSSLANTPGCRWQHGLASLSAWPRVIDGFLHYRDTYTPKNVLLQSNQQTWGFWWLLMKKSAQDEMQETLLFRIYSKNAFSCQWWNCHILW